MTSRISLQPGEEIYVGEPQVPISDLVMRQLREVMFKFPEISEMHLPQVYIPGLSNDAKQVLVFTTNANLEKVSERVINELNLKFSDGFSIDIWPLNSNNSILNAIRKTKTQLKP